MECILNAAHLYLAQHAELRGRQPRHGLLQLGPYRHIRLGDEEQPAAEKCEGSVEDEALAAVGGTPSKKS